MPLLRKRLPIPGRFMLPIFLILATTAAALAAPVSPGKPQVVVSIQPLALLVAEVAGDEVDISTLVEAGQSPHSFQLRPSGRRSLAEADLIVWVGPTLELFLQRLMAQDDLSGKALAVGSNSQDSSAVHEHAQPAQPGPLPQTQTQTTRDHHHGAGAEDPHVWLDPTTALELARSIATALQERGLVDKAVLEQNLSALEARLSALDRDIRQRFATSSPASIFTYHAAFSRFAEHYGLEIAGSLTASPEVQPGARHMSEILDRLRKAEAPCVLTEPQFDRRWWRGVTDGTNISISSWDPLATTVVAKPGSYTQFLEGLAEAVLSCARTSESSR